MVPQPFCDNVQHRLCREDASQPRNAGLTLATVTAGYVGGGRPWGGREGGRASLGTLPSTAVHVRCAALPRAGHLVIHEEPGNRCPGFHFR